MILYERNMIACCGTIDLSPLPERIKSHAKFFPQTYSHNYVSYNNIQVQLCNVKGAWLATTVDKFDYTTFLIAN